MDRISVIIPCYNEEEAIPVYYQAMKKVMESMKKVIFELLFVDDGSTDGTLPAMRFLAARDSRCRYLSFSRNFGKEAAMYAGLSKAKGDFVTVMDVDLQDPPSLLPKMYELLKEGTCGCVAARRMRRTGEGRLKSFLSDSFYQVMKRLTKTDIKSGARDYRLMCRPMVDAILEMSEYNRFTKGIFEWVGFETQWLEYDYEDRCAGETKWPLRKLFAYALEAVTGFSTAPLSFASAAGIFFLLVSVGMLAVLLFQTVVVGVQVPGWASVVCLLLFIGGIQLICTGIVGLYLSKTYLETKHRPIYILKEASLTSVGLSKCSSSERRA
ncbi:MAG: glycosyltransferase family 2 protein [Blautia sp.]|jgi:glucosyltransferase